MDAKKLIQTAILAALVAVTTMVVNVPLPGVKGYVNIGDAVVLLAGLMLGPAVGAFSGALGSSLADLLLGYAHWAPWTLIIKGVEGFLAGWLVLRLRRGGTVFGAVVGAAVMVLGYFLVGILYYGWAAAVVSLPGDLLQGGVSAALCLIVIHPLRKYLKPVL
ncbi:MAG TPA: ECF transporter S component [Firmicutes bacterium]|nr:ECF transporter S component [Bacillota bacterium]